MSSIPTQSQLCTTYNPKLGVQSIWAVQNNQPFIDAIKKELNNGNKSLSIATFGSSTLYVNIPLNKLTL